MKPKTIKISKIRAIPLKNGESGIGVSSFDYTLAYKTGLKFTIKPDLKAFLKNIATAAFSGGLLSYKYKDGDTTIFEVAFSYGKVRDKFVFVT